MIRLLPWTEAFCPQGRVWSLLSFCWGYVIDNPWSLLRFLSSDLPVVGVATSGDTGVDGPLPSPDPTGRKEPGGGGCMILWRKGRTLWLQGMCHNLIQKQWVFSDESGELGWFWMSFRKNRAALLSLSNFNVHAADSLWTFRVKILQRQIEPWKKPCLF